MRDVLWEALPRLSSVASEPILVRPREVVSCEALEPLWKEAMKFFFFLKFFNCFLGKIQVKFEQLVGVFFCWGEG